MCSPFGHRSTMVVTCQNHSGILNSTSCLNRCLPFGPPPPGGGGFVTPPLPTLPLFRPTRASNTCQLRWHSLGQSICVTACVRACVGKTILKRETRMGQETPPHDTCGAINSRSACSPVGLSAFLSGACLAHCVRARVYGVQVVWAILLVLTLVKFAERITSLTRSLCVAWNDPTPGHH